MQFAAIHTLLQKQFGETTFPTADPEALQPWVEVLPAHLVEVCKFLRDTATLYFDHLACLSGVDYGEEAEKIGVVYHLTSLTQGLQLVLKVSLPRTLDPLPSVPSVSSIWRTAEWHEREAYDLVGIHFEGHPDLRRILLPEDWVGHPLRKDYTTDTSYHGIAIDY